MPVVPEGEPDEVGFPLLIKAAAGGGGRGMRVVREPGELDEALAAARSEAKAAFGDERVFCERYVERPRHVEIQLLGDAHGNVVALGERECSIQRRHQKVLEEAPSPALDPELRARMSEAAVAFARRDRLPERRHRRVHARRPRLLVPGAERAHPGRAPGDGARDRRRPRARSSSESPRASRCEPSRASSGTRSRCGCTRRIRARSSRRPARSSGCGLPTGIRVDAGVEEGDEIGTAYDPLIAKLIAHGGTREEALDRLAAALAETDGRRRRHEPALPALAGRHPALRAGETTTAFLTEHPPLSAPPLRLADRPWPAASASTSPCPPPTAPPDADAAAHERGGARSRAALSAPMPGTVIKVLVAEGDRVQPRQPLVVLEAMKMETPVVSPYEAVVRAVHVTEGDRVAGGDVLVELEE